jgi:Uma2 family endonuclease
MNEFVPHPPLLETGDHLDQKTFHERYSLTAPGFKAELIGGMVFVASPVRSPHGQYHGLVVEWLGRYCTATPGVLLHDNSTVILGESSEPQPDACLSLEPAWGGKSRVDERDYVVGPPELIVEVAHSSQSFDLFEKLRDYEQGGVLEYIVVAIRDGAVRWFVLRDGKDREEQLSGDGVFCSTIFPGLWLDATALLRLDRRGVQRTLEQGLASPEHIEFAEKLKH